MDGVGELVGNVGFNILYLRISYQKVSSLCAGISIMPDACEGYLANSSSQSTVEIYTTRRWIYMYIGKSIEPFFFH